MLSKEQQSANQADSSTAESKVSSRRPSTDGSRVYDQTCIFCNGVKYLSKGSRTRAPLVRCRELRADSTIRAAATRKNDTKLLALLSRELVAAEGHYHRTCYRIYTRPENPSLSIKDANAGAESENADLFYDDAMQLAREDLFSHIRNDLFLNPNVVPLVHLSTRFMNKLTELGVTNIKDSTKKHFRRMLDMEFEETLKFVNDDNGRVLVYPSSLDLDTAVLKLHGVRRQLEAVEEQTDESNIIKAALMLRDTITSRAINDDWPLMPQSQPSHSHWPSSTR